jgi:hypothetical protein
MAQVFSKRNPVGTTTGATNERFIGPLFPAAGDVWVLPITKAEALGRRFTVLPITANATHINNYGQAVVDNAGAITALAGSGTGFVAVAALSTANKCNIGFVTISGVEYVAIAILGTQWVSTVVNGDGSLICKVD